jgi:molecular chaperone IbpA
VNYIHKGITTKDFSRTFRLAEYTLVDGAELKDGILSIHLRVEIPEEKKPRQIAID